MERNLKISLDEAKKLYQQGNQAVNTLLLQTFTKEELEKKKLPESWEELGEISGVFIDNFSRLQFYPKKTTIEHNKNIFRTKEQAEAAIALAQLSQLMYVWNDGWEADWDNLDQPKYCIVFNEDGLSISILCHTKCFLSFKTREIAEQFISYPEIKKLIEQAKPLL